MNSFWSIYYLFIYFCKDISLYRQNFVQSSKNCWEYFFLSPHIGLPIYLPITLYIMIVIYKHFPTVTKKSQSKPRKAPRCGAACAAWTRRAGWRCTPPRAPCACRPTGTPSTSWLDLLRLSFNVKLTLTTETNQPTNGDIMNISKWKWCNFNEMHFWKMYMIEWPSPRKGSIMLFILFLSVILNFDFIAGLIASKLAIFELR